MAEISEVYLFVKSFFFLSTLFEFLFTICAYRGGPGMAGFGGNVNIWIFATVRGL